MPMTDPIRNTAPRTLSSDPNALDALKRRAARDPSAAAPLAARQFEAVFLQQMLKSSRESTTGGGLFDNESTKVMTSMLDQQYAQALAQKGTGLAPIIEKAMLRSMQPAPATKGTE
jgi:flagellar protein FlgJ